jgi:hypothetical protein
MKKYSRPEMEINTFENTEMIATTVSAGIVKDNFSFEKGYNEVSF